MIQPRIKLEIEINNKLDDTASTQRYSTYLSRLLRDKYNIMEKDSADYIIRKKNLSETSNFYLYALADVLGINPASFFSSKEIEEFSHTKVNDFKIEFPLRFKMTQINDEQYIGKISMKDLMELKEAQLINYNENSQRTMKRIIRGDTEFYQIYLNKKAVSEITKSYESGLYIPNTITLNMPDETDFYYAEKESELVIREINHFDIIDGYHRYIAMSKIATLNPDFDYDMELRIVQFEESKAKRFIWQEDQKTKMRKIDSDSMNPASIANKIVNRMNMDIDFNLSGQISRNKGIINAACLSDIIDVLLIKRMKKSEERKFIKDISTKLIEVINDFTDEHEEYLTKPWDRVTTLVVIYDYLYRTPDEIVQDIETVKNAGNIYQSTKLQKADITKLKKILPEGG